MAAASRGLARVLRAVQAAADSASSPQRSISVMTYNILAQKYAQNGWHNYCPSQHLRWESRKERLLQEIAEYGSDIVCLQEVESSVYADELRPWMAKRGYEGHYLARQYGENVQPPPEGVALFYRREAFEPLHSRSVLFSSVPTQPPAPSALSSVDSDDSPAATPAPSPAANANAATSLWDAATSAATTGALSGSDAESGSDTDGGGTESAEDLPEATGGPLLRSTLSPAGDPASASAMPPLGASAPVPPTSPGSSLSRRPPTATPGGGGGGGGGKSRRSRAGRGAALAAPSSSAPLADGGVGTSGRGGSGGGRGSGAGNNEFWSVFMRRHEGAILVLLRHRPSNKAVLAAVTHLFWNPAFPDVKAFQAAVLCSEMASFLRQHGGVAPEAVPVVLAGDFNSLSRKRVPDAFDPKIPRGSDGLVSGVYTLLTRGSLPPDHPDHPASRRRPGETGNPDFRDAALTSAGLKLASAYYLANGRDPALTTRTATFAGCLDYIFVSPRHFDVTRTLELPYEGDAPGSSEYGNVRDPLSVAFPPIPNDVYPSDHLSLVAVLRLKE